MSELLKEFLMQNGLPAISAFCLLNLVFKAGKIVENVNDLRARMLMLEGHIFRNKEK